MKNIFSVSIILLITLSSFMSTDINDESISIIVHPENPYDKIPPTTVRVFWLRTGKKRWDKINVGIKPVDRKCKCTEREQFLSRIVEMKSNQVESYFTAKQYQYAELPPAVFSTDKEIIEFVANEPGAIAYVSTSSLAETTAKVKVVYQF